jgi:CheY-like chemotaxis protein
MHEGRITAESEGAGRGSRFTVMLPAAPAAATQAEAPPAARDGATPKRVLVVDDNADAAETLSQLLEILGHMPATANDGTSALQAFDAFTPDVVLLDIGLPDLDGYEVARRIRAGSERPVRLVALTGWGQAEDKRRAAEAGFDAHWTKPVDPARLHEL